MPVISTGPRKLNLTGTMPDDEHPMGPVDPKELEDKQKIVDTNFYKEHANDPMWKRIALDLPNVPGELLRGFFGGELDKSDPNYAYNPSYWANAGTQLIQAADPLIKGIGASAPSLAVTLYKDAKGKPSQSLRRYFTDLFLKDAEAHGKDAVQGAERLAQRYPRAVSRDEFRPETVANKGEYKNTEALVTPDKPDKFGRTPLYLTEKGKKAIAQEGPDKAIELLGHETGHVATNALTPGGMMSDYNQAKNIVPYREIPHEITAFARGNKLRTGDLRAPINRMGYDVGQYAPDTERLLGDRIAAMRNKGYSDSDLLLQAAQKKLDTLRSTPQFTTNRGMENILNDYNVKDIPQSWKLQNTVDPEGMSDSFKTMMNNKFDKRYDNTIYSPEGTASTIIAAPFRAPRNRVRPPRYDFSPTYLSD